MRAFFAEQNRRVCRPKVRAIHERIRAKMPKGAFDGNSVSFQNTQKEREALGHVAREYDSRMPSPWRLSAHGTRNLLFLSSILFDRELLMRPLQECLTRFWGNGAPGLGGNHYDFGAGVLTIRWGALWDLREAAAANPRGDKLPSFPLPSFDAVVLPSELVPILRKEFPSCRNLIMGYSEYSETLLWRMRAEAAGE